MCVNAHKRLWCVLSRVGVCASASVIAAATVTASCAIASAVTVCVIARVGLGVCCVLCSVPAIAAAAIGCLCVGCPWSILGWGISALFRSVSWHLVVCTIAVGVSGKR